MLELYRELTELLSDFEISRQSLNDDAKIYDGYADDFYDMLCQIKAKLESFLND